MRSKAFFINGGAGRVICAIPALEKYEEQNPDDDFIIVAEGGTDFFKGHPTLFKKTYDSWHKNLFRDKLKDRDIVSTEPYRIWEYYNQKCNLSQAYDIQINGEGVRELQKPTIRLSRQEAINAKFIVEEVRQKTKKDKVVVFQPFGRGSQMVGNFVTDPSGRSFEFTNVVSIIKKLQKKYAVIYFGEMEFDFSKEGCKDPVAHPKGIDLRQWSAIVSESDLFIGCDSVGQHMAYSFDVPAVVVVGSTCKENISYPGCEKFDVLDMGEGQRIYDPIRVAADEVTQRQNDGIMAMNSAIEDVIIKSTDKLMNKYYVRKKDTVVLPGQDGAPTGACCPPQGAQGPMPGFAPGEASPATLPGTSKKSVGAVESLLKESGIQTKSNSKKGFVETVKN
tara:strand:+ start:2793 stop:3968 length:1176 start_codon:yes stop_codon:yes gene_type:complete